jgi:hypothetical protein
VTDGSDGTLYTKKKQNKDDTGVSVTGGNNCPTSPAPGSCGTGTSRKISSSVCFSPCPTNSSPAPCFSPCPASRTRYNPYVEQCEATVVLSSFNVTINESSIVVGAVVTSGSLRTVFVQLYSDVAKNTPIRPAFSIPITNGIGNINITPPLSTGTYYYSLKINDLSEGVTNPTTITKTTSAQSTGTTVQLPDVTGINRGALVTGTGVPANATVSSISSSGTISVELSSTPTSSIPSGTTLTFTTTSFSI